MTNFSNLAAKILFSFTLVFSASACTNKVTRTLPQPASVPSKDTAAAMAAYSGYWQEQPSKKSTDEGYLSASDLTIYYNENGKFYILHKYLDLEVEKVPSEMNFKLDANGNLLEEGDFNVPGKVSGKFTTTVSLKDSNTLHLKDVSTLSDGKVYTFDSDYKRIDETTAVAKTKKLWFHKKQNYPFTRKFCDIKSSLSAADSAMVDVILHSATESMKTDGTSITALKSERKAAGEEHSDCEIVEDYLTRGKDYAATGKFKVAYGATLSVNIDSIESLSALSALEIGSLQLQVSSNDKSNVKDFTPISKIPGLTSLTLENISLGQNATSYSSILSLNDLDDLYLYYSDFTDYGLLKRLPNLATLNVTGAKQPNEVIKTLAQIDQLHSLSFDPDPKDEFTDASAISNLKNLTSLRLSQGAFTNLAFLTELSQLNSLDILINNDQGVDVVSKLSGLKHLSVTKNIAGAADLKFVTKLPKLTSLSIQSSGDLSDLSPISNTNCPLLESLTINGNGTSQLGDLSAVSNFPSLTSLQIGDFALKDLSAVEPILQTDQKVQIYLYRLTLPQSQDSVNRSLTKKYQGRYQSSDLKFLN